MTTELRDDQKRLRNAVRRLRKYMNFYPKDSEYMNTLIEDVLYGLGVAIDPDQFASAGGFDKFKAILRDHLAISP